MKSSEPKNWMLYILKCQSKSGRILFYTGITNRWEKRYKMHCTGRGAKFTKMNKVLDGRPVLFNLTKSEALKLERKYKKLPHSKKQAVFIKKEVPPFDSTPSQP